MDMSSRILLSREMEGLSEETARKMLVDYGEQYDRLSVPYKVALLRQWEAEEKGRNGK